MKTAICDLFGIEYPIIQGGMGHISTAELVSAVSNAGALGIIASGFYPAAWVREQIRLTRQKTDAPFGVNIPMISPRVKEVVAVVLEEKVPVVATGAGNPQEYIASFKKAGIKVVPVVATVSAARRMAKAGVDAIVAEGMESGGHIGETTTMALVPQVVDAVDIPVIAAGGFADGRGLAAALALGAQGIQMGTRFVCSTECIAHPAYKQKILEANDHSTVVTGRPTGLPLRCFQNNLTEQFLALESAGAPPEVMEQLGRGKMFKGVIEGDVEEGTLPAGQIAGMIKDIKPVKEIIEGIISEAEKVIGGLRNFGAGEK
ncbi:MAG: nitronate monooxygenase [Dehalococcoidales bacterium]|nr:nitronate monooxygenase [Dehalococcoidales bacterium]